MQFDTIPASNSKSETDLACKNLNAKDANFSKSLGGLRHLRVIRVKNIFRKVYKAVYFRNIVKPGQKWVFLDTHGL